MQSPMGISWSGCLSSCSLNKKPSYPQANVPTYGSQNVFSNRVTGWDDEGYPMYIFLSLSYRWCQRLRSKLRGREERAERAAQRQRGVSRASDSESESSDVNFWHHRWRRLQKTYIGSSSSEGRVAIQFTKFFFVIQKMNVQNKRWAAF